MQFLSELRISNPSIYFTAIIIFIIIRQYTSAKRLRIEAENRIAMAKMFEKINKKDDKDYKMFLPHIVDAIAYSTIKTNQDSSIPENINTIKNAIKELTKSK